MSKDTKKQYHLPVEMRRLADALYTRAQTHPTDAMDCYKEARQLVRIAVDASTSAINTAAMRGTVKALEAHQDRLRKHVEARGRNGASAPPLISDIGDVNEQ